jgi:hypothetical protein
MGAGRLPTCGESVGEVILQIQAGGRHDPGKTGWSMG